MRLLVFFDLPTYSSINKKNYRIFRKFIIKEGFIMQQFSVYSKLIINDNEVKYQLKKLRANKPPDGLVQVLVITEKQFANMEYISGTCKNDEFLDNKSNLVTIC